MVTLHEPGPFRAASLQSRRAPFDGPGSACGVGDDRAPVTFKGYSAESCHQVLLDLAMLAPKQVLGPSQVVTFTLKREAILVTVDLCLAATVLSIDRSSPPPIQPLRYRGGIRMAPSRRIVSPLT